jgi:hypothetical protein
MAHGFGAPPHRAVTETIGWGLIGEEGNKRLRSIPLALYIYAVCVYAYMYIYTYDDVHYTAIFFYGGQCKVYSARAAPVA